MDSSSKNKHGNKINLRKEKLEKMRRERELLQLEKLKRGKTSQENIQEIHLNKEIREKAAKITDSKIDEINIEINPCNDGKEIVPTLKLNSQTNQCRSVKTLTYSALNIMEIPPQEASTFSKYTQTDNSRLHIPNIELGKYKYEHREYEDDAVGTLTLFCNFSSNLPPGILSPGLPQLTDIQPASTPLDKENPWNYVKEKKKKIAEDQYEKMILCENFKKSFKRVSLSMEKVLRNNKNIYVDYIGDVNGFINESNPKSSLNLIQVYRNENQEKGRCITSIDWSPHCTDRIVAAYYKNKVFPIQESDIDVGEDVIIWNQNIKSHTPEHVFHCRSSVMCSSFTKFCPNLILGATYSGQIVLWDSRVKTSMPVQCTKLNYNAHTQPINCLREIGCEGSRNVISISSDGKLCAWNLDMLTKPTDIMQLQFDVSEKTKKPISVTCTDFPANGQNNLVLGAEDGNAYSAFRFGYESGVNNCYTKHEAPITAISSHYNQTGNDFGNLFLTSSVDCTIKLWSLENAASLYTFKNNYDYVMDVAWSPVHPTVFIAADGNGSLDLYNLNENFEEPIKSINIKGRTAINRLQWSNNGKSFAFGTEIGELYLYKIAENLACPDNAPWLNFKNTLHSISVNYGIEYGN